MFFRGLTYPPPLVSNSGTHSSKAVFFGIPGFLPFAGRSDSRTTFVQPSPPCRGPLRASGDAEIAADPEVAEFLQAVAQACTAVEEQRKAAPYRPAVPRCLRATPPPPGGGNPTCCVGVNDGNRLRPLLPGSGGSAYVAP